MRADCEPKQTSSSRTYFLYDGATAICELNSSGSVTATNTIGGDGLISRHTTTSTFYDFDLSGNVAQRLSSSGTIVSTDADDAFGKRQTTDATNDLFAFSGQWGGYTDAATGLVLLEHRCYGPNAGRWVTRDPIGYEGGVNVYGYCGNSPEQGTDPTGYINLKAFEDCLKGILWSLFVGCMAKAGLGISQGDYNICMRKGIATLIGCILLNVVDDETLLIPCLMAGLEALAVGMAPCFAADCLKGIGIAIATKVATCLPKLCTTNSWF